ncbi:dynein light chain Tctex-type 5-like [Symsagittifera roscoffensis]|uniref:dynein light chain Tctex-type 5-like n=1 Tax=Symsagittifera roscoffensis TaxID=84072 RepID=UPI00307C6ABF
MHGNPRRTSVGPSDLSQSQRRTSNTHQHHNKYRGSLDAFIKEQRKITTRVEEFHSDDNQSQSSRGGGLLSQVDTSPMPKLENTYRLEPVGTLPTTELRQISESIMHRMLQGKTYDHEKLGELTKLIPEEVKLQAKVMLNNCAGGNRYKLIAHTTIGQIDNQGIHLGSRSLWNAKFDQEIVATFSNNSLFAVTAIYALYFE